MFSDNGINFVGAERELRESLAVLNHDTIQQRLLARGIKWSFNPPFGSHHGGSWERLMDSNVKNYKMLHVYYSIIVNWILWTIRGRDVGAISAVCDLFVIFMLFGNFWYFEYC